MLYYTKAGDMLDAICVAFYGQSAGAVERVLEANRHLADLGEVYASGVIIELPDIPASDLKKITERKIKVFE